MQNNELDIISFLIKVIRFFKRYYLLFIVTLVISFASTFWLVSQKKVKTFIAVSCHDMSIIDISNNIDWSNINNINGVSINTIAGAENNESDVHKYEVIFSIENVQTASDSLFTNLNSVLDRNSWLSNELEIKKGYLLNMSSDLKLKKEFLLKSDVAHIQDQENSNTIAEELISINDKLFEINIQQRVVNDHINLLTEVSSAKNKSKARLQYMLVLSFLSIFISALIGLIIDINRLSKNESV